MGAPSTFNKQRKGGAAASSIAMLAEDHPVGMSVYMTCMCHQITTLEQCRPWDAGADLSLPGTCSQAATPLALPVLMPDMVLTRPFCQGTPGEKHITWRPGAPTPTAGKPLSHSEGRLISPSADQNGPQLGLSSPGYMGLHGPQSCLCACHSCGSFKAEGNSWGLFN